MNSPTLAASILSAEADNTVWENLIYLATGFVIVIGALAILWALCVLIGFFFIGKAEAAAKALAEAEAAAAADEAKLPVASEEVTDPAVIAVITAAIEIAVHKPLRIVSVRSSHHPDNNEVRHNAWALEGRSSHFQSHKVR